MPDRFKMIIDGFEICVRKLYWLEETQRWYVHYYDEKFPLRFNEQASIRYVDNVLTFESKYNYNNQRGIHDGEKRFLQFIEEYIEENRFYFLLNKPEDIV